MEVLRHLVASAAWGLVAKSIQEQVELRQRELAETSVRNVEEIASFNMKQGIKLGLMLALQFPSQLIEAREDVWKAALEEQRHEHSGKKSGAGYADEFSDGGE